MSLLTKYGLMQFYKNPIIVRNQLVILEELLKKKLPKLQIHFVRRLYRHYLDKIFL